MVIGSFERSKKYCKLLMLNNMRLTCIRMSIACGCWTNKSHTMNKPKYIITAISLLMAASAQAQSWGFTLPGGGGFAYSTGKNGSVSLANGSFSGGSYAACRGPVLIPDYGATRIAVRPSYRREPWCHQPVPYVDHAGFVRRGPRTSYTSHWVVYPNVW